MPAKEGKGPSTSDNLSTFARDVLCVGGDSVEHESPGKILARVLVCFQSHYLSSSMSKHFSQCILCQLWLPYTSSPGGDVRLRTNGQPFFVAGTEGSDLLSLFRCLSCRYEFGTDDTKPRELGAPGRVFLSAGPEVQGNVQQLDAAEYHRRPSAELCSVESCMLIPVFASSKKNGGVVAVIEVLGNGDGLDYLAMVEMLGTCLHAVGMSTSSVDEVKLHMTDEILLDMGAKGVHRTIPPEKKFNAFENALDASMTQLIHGEGFASRNDSKRLKMSPRKLKALMKQKNINTISKKHMDLYQEDVNHVLGDSRSADHLNLPLSRGMDSRWNMSRGFPRNRSRHRRRHEPSIRTAIGPPDGAFPIQPSRRGRIEPRVELLQESSGSDLCRTKGQESGCTNLAPWIDKGTDVAGTKGDYGRTPAKKMQSKVFDNNNTHTMSPSTQDDDDDEEDWLGMIDPGMLDIMMMNDFGEELGDIGDISGLPPT